MKIANEFTVSAPVAQTWDVLTDLEQVVPLMPGAQLVGQEGDEYLGKVKVKVGPVTSEFSGKARFVERDGDAHRAVVNARGKEARGTGNAAATITLSVHDAGERSRVSIDTDLKIVGKLAQFGSGMLQQVSEKLLGEFVDSLEARLAGGQESGADAIAAAPKGNSVPAQAPRPAQPSEPEPIDLVALAGGGALKKYAPAVFGVIALAAIAFILGRLRIARRGR
ncbi:SRPBCC family protein [Mycobacterium barrassiae]|uniref:SRPBCC family protein n=1 Tax=Mycobacterium barrassiae TaxID=319709 RepID=UPI002265F234|nr:SRPBCC family protein [Mycobacterium barrassiae]MCV7302367.1 SRPBCC family protein [Mycobacterium barrassiae]